MQQGFIHVPVLFSKLVVHTSIGFVQQLTGITVGFKCEIVVCGTILSIRNLETGK